MPGSSLQSSGCDLLTPEFVKFSMDLTNSELSAASSAPTVGPPGAPYGPGFDMKPPCVFQAPPHAGFPCVKTEERPQAQDRQLPGSAGSGCCYRPPSPVASDLQGPPGLLWENPPPLCPLHHDHLQRRRALSRFSLCSLKHAPAGGRAAPAGPVTFEGSLHVPVALDGVGARGQLGAPTNVPLPRPHGHCVTELPPHAGRAPACTEGVCAVCGDSAACQHYGVRTCEGCKGFFKRTVQKDARYVCLAARSCPVDKRRRNRCQFCRFQKCLSVGMAREVVRTDGLKGRRGRLPSKPRAPQDTPPAGAALLSALIQAHVECDPPPSRLDFSQFQEHPGSPVAAAADAAAQHVRRFYERLTRSMEATRRWARKVPGYGELLQQDQELLFNSAFLELFVLRLAYRSRADEGRLVFCDGLVLHRLQCGRGFGEWLDAILAFSSDLRRMELDVAAFSCVCALTLLSERHGLKEPQRVAELQRRVQRCLRDARGDARGDEDPVPGSRWGSEAPRWPELRALCVQGLQRIFYLKLEDLVAPPPAIDKLFLDTLPF